MAYLTPEVLDEKPLNDIHKAMVKDLVAAQKKLGTRDGFFVAVQGLPLKGGKRVSLLIAASTHEPVAEWVERFKASTSKAKLLAEGKFAFAKGADAQIVIELKKFTGAARTAAVAAVAKALVNDSRFTVRDALAPVRHHEGSESESEEHH